MFGSNNFFNPEDKLSELRKENEINEYWNIEKEHKEMVKRERAAQRDESKQIILKLRDEYHKCNCKCKFHKMYLKNELVDSIKEHKLRFGETK